ncbi:MAG: hypothetical protein BGN96_08105 [Bacteroidales bacterium 45-6]|nr:MAG: hypothetical protein BGN96_08105 [Bacteroidales bacterium 45-6]
MKLVSLALAVFLAIALDGCVSEIPVEVEGAEVPVVNCVLTNDTVQTLSLTKSVKISDTRLFREIKDAKIVLLTEGQTAGEFARTGYGKWELHYQPVAGKRYSLVVTLADGTELSATTTMPRQNRIVKNSSSDAYPSKYFKQMSAQSPCWTFVLEQNDLPDNLLHPTPSAKAWLKQHIGTDHPLVDRFNDDGGLSAVLPQATTPAYSYYVRIRPSAEVAPEGIPFCIQTNFGGNDFVCFRNASEEYDNYLKSSFEKLWLYSSEDDPIQWFDETVVYSNISNGVGIFGAYSDVYFFYNE